MTDRAIGDNGLHEVVADTAKEAVEQLECSREHACWMVALCRAIRDDLSSGGGHNAKHLADSQWSALDEHIGRATERMGSLGLRH